jgi:predicted permease
MFFMLLPVLFSIALGYILYRATFLTDGMVEGFKKIVINVTLPALLLGAFMSIQFKAQYLLIFLAVFLACLLLLVIANGIAKMFKIRSPYFPFLLTGFEAGMVGYGLFVAIYGDGSAATLGVIDVGQVLFVFVVLVPMVMMLGTQRTGGEGIKDSLSIAVKSPVVWAIIVGVMASIFGITKHAATPWYGHIQTLLSYIAVPTSFLIALVIGSGLNFKLKNMKMELITSVVRLAFTILLAFVIKYLVLMPLGLVDQYQKALFIMFVLPGPFVIPAFMKNPSPEDKAYVSNTLSLGTLLSLVAVFIIVLVMK